MPISDFIRELLTRGQRNRPAIQPPEVPMPDPGLGMGAMSRPAPQPPPGLPPAPDVSASFGQMPDISMLPEQLQILGGRALDGASEVGGRVADSARSVAQAASHFGYAPPGFPMRGSNPRPEPQRGPRGEQNVGAAAGEIPNYGQETVRGTGVPPRAPTQGPGMPPVTPALIEAAREYVQQHMPDIRMPQASGPQSMSPGDPMARERRAQSIPPAREPTPDRVPIPEGMAPPQSGAMPPRPMGLLSGFEGDAVTAAGPGPQAGLMPPPVPQQAAAPEEIPPYGLMPPQQQGTMPPPMPIAPQQAPAPPPMPAPMAGGMDDGSGWIDPAQGRVMAAAQFQEMGQAVPDRLQQAIAQDQQEIQLMQRLKGLLG